TSPTRTRRRYPTCWCSTRRCPRTPVDAHTPDRPSRSSPTAPMTAGSFGHTNTVEVASTLDRRDHVAVARIETTTGGLHWAMVKLRDGSEVRDRRLARLREFDPRSRKYSIIDVVGRKKPRSHTWHCAKHLDQ